MENTRKVAPLLLPSSSFLRTYGIEIELNIVDRITGRPATHEAMTAFWAKLDRLPQSWWDQYQSLGITRATFTREAPVWVVEINSPRCHSFTKMRNWLQTVMSILRELLKEFELVPIGCDLHLQAGPFSRNDMPPSYRGIWDHYNREDGSNPIRLSGMATGTHIHYGTYEDEAETF